MRNTDRPSAGIVEIDIHGMNKYQAKILIESKLKAASSRTLYYP